MAIQSEAPSSEKPCQRTRQTRISFASPDTKRKTILPTERWLLIREKAYIRAQRRGLVGGNPYTDWLESEREIDAKYVTDERDVSSLTEPAEINEQVKKVLARYGLGDLGVDALLEKHSVCMQRLASRLSAG